jgi:hypothetical protein
MNLATLRMWRWIKFYHGFSVYYKECDETVKVFVVFRFACSNGTTLVLSKPSQIELNNGTLKVDSNDFCGAYYKDKKLAAQGMGKTVRRFN